MKMKKLNSCIVFLCMVVTLVFCGCETQDKHTPDTRDVVKVPLENIEKVSSVWVDNVHTSIGTVMSKTTARISSKVTGYIFHVNVKEGDEVKAGDLLLVLESKELESRKDVAANVILEARKKIAEAEAEKDEAASTYKLAEITLMRTQDLVKKQSVSIQKYDEAKADYDRAKAKFKKAQEALGAMEARRKQATYNMKDAESVFQYTEIKAPFHGIVTRKNIHEGDLAVPGNILLVIDDNQNYQFKAVIEESKLLKIKSGQKIMVKLDALSNKKIPCRVSEIIPRIDPVTRTFEIKIDLPELSGIMSGMYGKAYFSVGRHSLLLVPKTALVQCGQLSSIYIVSRAGVVERRLVKTGKTYDDNIEILSGLDPGESVIVRELFKVTDGCLVEHKS
jgi:RND family efflux transporter MFP subunit